MNSSHTKSTCEVVAIDGPAGAGKSTVAKLVAERVGYNYLDTGAMYRAVTLKVLQSKISFENREAIAKVANNINIRFETNDASIIPEVFLDDVNVTLDIRKPEVTKNVSFIAAIPEVRECMTRLQREIGHQGKWVVDGRDIGSVVFPDARVKIFLTASIEARAQRRFLDLQQKGFEADIDTLKKEIARRDEIDSNREVAPLIQPEGAIYLDTTALSIDQVVDRIIEIVTNTRDKKIPSEEKMDQLNTTTTDQEQNKETMENQVTMEEAISSEFQTISKGAILTGTIIEKNQSSIYVDLSYKSDGIIPIEDFGGEEANFNVGDKIRVYVKQIDDGHGQLLLSYRRAKELDAWDAIGDAYTRKIPIEGILQERIKGGYNVSIRGMRAFLPQSQLSHGKNTKENIGKAFPVMVIEFNRRRKNIVVSERAILDRQRDKRREEIFNNYNVNDLIKGTVSRIVEYGVFVDLGDGVEGLIHRNNLSWSVISNPREVVQPGEEIEAKILKLDVEKKKIHLGLKQKKEDPWKTVDIRYKVGQKYPGKVKNLMDFGAFVELEEGVEGLIHISDLSWSRNIKHPREVVNSGDNIEVVIKEIDQAKKRISLSYKEILPHPWDNIEKRYKIGDIVTGKVNNMTDFGAFIEIEQGIEGLLHVSDMDWVKKINHPKEILEKGQEVKVKILNIDIVNRRMSLGLKQTTTDPWETVEENYKPGQQVTGVVKNLVSYGAFVQLENGLEGLLHISELSWQNDVSDPAEVLKVGDQITVIVYEIDKNKQKIGLSLRRLHEDPWKDIEHRYPKGSIHEGKVTTILENGVEVKLSEGVIGFIHISQLSAQRVNNPSEAVKEGQQVMFKILEIDRKNRRLKLSIKEAAIDSDAKELQKYQTESNIGFSDTIGDLLKDQFESFKQQLEQ